MVKKHKNLNRAEARQRSYARAQVRNQQRADEQERRRKINLAEVASIGVDVPTRRENGKANSPSRQLRYAKRTALHK